MVNIPEVKTGILAVSRDCFPIDLSRNRRKRVVEECRKKNIPVIECETIVENERDVLKALDELDGKDINALVIYLGNFGPEGPLSMLAERFDGPVMLVGAAEDAGDKLIDDRGDVPRFLNRRQVRKLKDNTLENLIPERYQNSLPHPNIKTGWYGIRERTPLRRRRINANLSLPHSALRWELPPNPGPALFVPVLVAPAAPLAPPALPLPRLARPRLPPRPAR